MRTARGRLVIAAAVLAAGLLLAPGAQACPFCIAERGPTLVGDYNQAAMVLVGTFVNAQPGGGGLEGGTTDFIIEEGGVLKDHPIRKRKMKISLPRFLPNQKNKYVIFCDVFKNLIDPYRGVEVMPKSNLIAYLKGALAARDKALPDRLRYCFDYLNDNDFEVSIDAYREFAKANYDDYKDMARKLPPDKLAEWLQDTATPTYRYGLYGSLLGLCATDKHARLLRDLLKEPKVRKSSGVDGVLVGYVTALGGANKKAEALGFLKGVLDNPREEFLMRYAVLRTLRFFKTTRKDLFTEDELVGTLVLTLNHPDIADFGIEDLRKWHRWDTADQVLDLMHKKSHSGVRIVRRAVLRYALQCPSKECQAFVAEHQRLDPEWVTETRQLLDLENTIEPTVPLTK